MSLSMKVWTARDHELEPPLNVALEKALRRHVMFRTANAMELWRDLQSPPSLPGAGNVDETIAQPNTGLEPTARS